ncbi:mechanosensitive ion channel family protein [Eubacteriaceae bacterium Marseille-Q4139]|nr:mechanosensitive ion channel family protein [Eubacteriaceae bacterium Marseille-Q4139]
METVKGWGPQALDFAVRLALAALILIVGFKVIGIIRKMVRRSLERAEVEITLLRFLDALLNAVLLFLLIFMAAQQLGMNTASIVAVTGSAGLALGLALQGSLANFAGGVLILFMKPFRVDDYIVTEEGEGTVYSIGLVYTTLLSIDNKKVVIPNGTLSNMTITNVTTMEKRRLDLTVTIGYQADLKRAKELLETLYADSPEIIKEDGITVYVDSLTGNGVVIGVRGWVKTEDYWPLRWRLLEEIKLTFEREGIEIPYNYMNVRMIGEK